MSGVAIYMEGGGTGRVAKSALRLGMDAFLAELKEAARSKSWKWKLVCCGGRQQAFRAYCNALSSNDYSLIVLLVDSEGPVTGQPHLHLNERDGWNLGNEVENGVHLMTQTMETWIAADADALPNCYRQGFVPNALPKSDDLEAVAETGIRKALFNATAKTKKGECRKTRHASSLLKIIDPRVVRKRCSFCERLFWLLGLAIAENRP
ncbi:MAG: DUF4276 family protein [Albidovulum sp.]|nr:DUF4276 family protein [Albidovulum sp.]